MVSSGVAVAAVRAQGPADFFINEERIAPQESEGNTGISFTELGKHALDR